MLFNCKNINDSFDTNEAENGKYLFYNETKDCMDLYHVGVHIRTLL